MFFFIIPLGKLNSLSKSLTKYQSVYLKPFVLYIQTDQFFNSQIKCLSICLERRSLIWKCPTLNTFQDTWFIFPSTFNTFSCWMSLARRLGFSVYATGWRAASTDQVKYSLPLRFWKFNSPLLASVKRTYVTYWILPSLQRGKMTKILQVA